MGVSSRRGLKLDSLNAIETYGIEALKATDLQDLVAEVKDLRYTLWSVRSVLDEMETDSKVQCTAASYIGNLNGLLTSMGFPSERKGNLPGREWHW